MTAASPNSPDFTPAGGVLPTTQSPRSSTPASPTPTAATCSGTRKSPPSSPPLPATPVSPVTLPPDVAEAFDSIRNYVCNQPFELISDVAGIAVLEVNNLQGQIKKLKQELREEKWENAKLKMENKKLDARLKVAIDPKFSSDIFEL